MIIWIINLVIIFFKWSSKSEQDLLGGTGGGSWGREMGAGDGGGRWGRGIFVCEGDLCLWRRSLSAKEIFVCEGDLSLWRRSFSALVTLVTLVSSRQGLSSALQEVPGCWLLPSPKYYYYWLWRNLELEECLGVTWCIHRVFSWNYQGSCIL